MDYREGRSQRLQPIRLSQGLAKLDDFVKGNLAERNIWITIVCDHIDSINQPV